MSDINVGTTGVAAGTSVGTNAFIISPPIPPNFDPLNVPNGIQTVSEFLAVFTKYLLVDGKEISGQFGVFDICWSLEGAQPDGIVFPMCALSRNVIFPADFMGSQCRILQAPSAPVTYTFSKIDLLGVTTIIGTLVINPDSSFQFQTTGHQTIVCIIGEELTVTTPSPIDSTLLSVSFTIAGQRTS